MRHLHALAFLGIVGFTASACVEIVATSSNPLPPLTASSGAGGEGGGQGGAAGAAGAAGGGGAGGSGSGGGCDAAPAVIVQQGEAGRILLRGVVVTPEQVFDGEVLIAGTTLACVAASCAADPNAEGASIVDTKGILLPGLIDTHNHILFDIFDEDDWYPTQTYPNHNEWPDDEKYKALVDAKQYLNGEIPESLFDLGCELNKYGELKGLVAGTTSIIGSLGAAEKSCYGSLSRTIDQSPNDLPEDKVQTATRFPTNASADGVCTNFDNDATDAFLIHVGEGVDAEALDEFTDLGTVTTTDGCLYAPETTIIHGTAFGEDQFTIMANNGMSLSWSPRSNVFLYGGGVDLGKTTNIPLARAKGINVALSPDWSIGGSQNLLDELRFADQVDNTEWGDILTPKDLTEMVTINAAKALGLGDVLGSLTAGKKADVLVITGDTRAPHEALLAATPADVRLVIVNGVPLYGDDELQALGPASPGCESLPVCCADKFLCVAEAGGDATNKLGQTFAEINQTLSAGLEAYDAMCCLAGACYPDSCCDGAMNDGETGVDCGGPCDTCPFDVDLEQWVFSPLAPLVKCP